MLEVFGQSQRTDSWPIRAQHTSQNDELCKNGRVSEGAQRSNINVRNVENYLNFTLKCVNIELHQIHKIMLFLASSYDPFNNPKSLSSALLFVCLHLLSSFASRFG